MFTYVGGGGGGGTVSIAPETTKNTYMACTGVFTQATSATDVLVIQGSSSKTVRILQIRVESQNTTGPGIQRWYLIKRNTSGTNYSGGTSSTATNVPLDAGPSGTPTPAGTATIKHYTANPTTLATSIGTMDSRYVATLTASNFTSDADVLLLDYKLTGMAITLRGTGEYLAVNFNGAYAVGTSTPSFTVLWTEE